MIDGWSNGWSAGWADKDSHNRLSSTDALPTGFRASDPLKMTSDIESLRRCLAELSPMTQMSASIILDLPQPLGPTTPVRFPGRVRVVGSTNDLKPESLIRVMRMEAQHTPS